MDIDYGKIDSGFIITPHLALEWGKWGGRECRLELAWFLWYIVISYKHNNKL